MDFADSLVSAGAPVVVAETAWTGAGVAGTGYGHVRAR